MAKISEIIRCHQEFAAAQKTVDLLPRKVDLALQTCRDALVTLEYRLADIDYPVKSLILDPDQGQADRMAQLEAHTRRTIPAVLKQLWDVIGGISFVDLDDYTHVDFWDGLGITGAKEFCDGVYVENCSPELLEYIMDDFDAHQEDDAESEFIFTFAPDGYHKDDISGGPPYGLNAGEWLPLVCNFEWTGYRRPESANSASIDFMGYLRTAILECGGFPGLIGHPKFEPIRMRLVEGLPAF